MESVDCRRDHGNVEQEGWFAAGGGLSFRCHLWSFRFCYAAISTLRPHKTISTTIQHSSTPLSIISDALRYAAGNGEQLLRSGTQESQKWDIGTGTFGTDTKVKIF
ncbi:hypothetical protein NC653_038680 [Populus alba x Populus x berolinensis]|uniref:Uncharacterized protein n=1 Tax=Populus alba x Populus x berolinensis TaxID=444605 RepID=A0AAD6PV69_9ROSI|nr:hypothetical protein NC653_038680 [Populus alba x Populus x berolinensis]